MRYIKKDIEELSSFLAGDHTRLREVLRPEQDHYPEPFSLAYAELVPGKSSLPHKLLAAAEVYIVISGKGEMEIEGDRLPLGPGSVVYLPAGAAQHVNNTGGENLCFYCVVSPPWKKENEKILDRTTGAR